MRAQRWNLLTLMGLLVVAFVWILYSVGSDAEAPTSQTTSTTGRSEISPDPDTEAAPDLARTSIDVPPDSRVRVRGRVLDAYGDPVGNTFVGEVASDRPTVTASDGQFDLLLESSSSTELLVLAAGHAPFLSEQVIQPGAEVHDAGDIQLLPGGGIRGQITDRLGNGIQDATAALNPTGSAWPASLDLTQLLKPASTDAQGLYSFANLMPGRYRVTASAPGMQAVQSGTMTVGESGEIEMDPLVLEVGYGLTGTVLGPNETPVVGALLQFRNGPNQPRYRGQTETTADGLFQMASMPPGPLQVEVTRQGFLRYTGSDIDPTQGEELIVRLEEGLRVTGTVVDSRTGQPVEEFAASIRRIGRVAPSSLGSMEQQLQRQIEALRADAAGLADPEARSLQLRIATEFESRLDRVRREEQSRPVAVPADVGSIEDHPEGRFSLDGMEEGLYAVGIASPEHMFAEVEPVELRQGMPAPDLRVELVEGHGLSGVVVSKHDGAPTTGATVELVRVLEPSVEVRELGHSLYPWVFATSGPQGVTVMSTRTDSQGRFEFLQAAPGQSLLSVRHPEIADHDTAAFYLQGGRQEMRVAVGARASLTGRIGNIPPEGDVEVIVLGGHGTSRTAKVQADGTYRFDGLQPGSYIVRAFPADDDRYVTRLFGSIFPLHAGGVDPDNIPPRDVILAEGQTQVFDLMLDLPPTGIVEGTISINGQPGTGGNAILRPVPGEAPGSGGLSLRADYDDLGRFTIRDVPAGNYTLALSSSTRQELYREPITVAPNTTAPVQVNLASGGLSGRVTAPDAAPDDLTGYLWVLPGATEAPADLYAYRRDNRTHRIRVRGGVFADAGLTPGPAVLVLDIRDRNRVVTQTVIQAGSTTELTIPGGMQ